MTVIFDITRESINISTSEHYLIAFQLTDVTSETFLMHVFQS